MNKPMADEQRKLGFITPAEAARLFRIPIQTVYAWMHKGQLVHKRIGLRRYYVSVKSFRALVGVETSQVQP